MLGLSYVLKLVKILVLKNISYAKSKTVANLTKHSFARMNVAEFVASSTPAAKNIDNVVVNELFHPCKGFIFNRDRLRQP